MSSTFPCSGSVSKFLTSLMFSKTSTTSPSTWTKTWLIVRDPSRFLTKMFVLPEGARSSSTKSSGLTTLKKKQLGNAKIIFGASSQTSLVPKPSKSRDEIYFKGGRIVTSQNYYQYYYSKIVSQQKLLLNTMCCLWIVACGKYFLLLVLLVCLK